MSSVGKTFYNHHETDFIGWIINQTENQKKVI